MGSDSDDDFQRFLQEEDSASVSSASPVRRKVVKDTKPSSSRKTASSKTKSGSSSKSYGGSSRSVFAAAEKLLAGSARAKSKKAPVVEEAAEDDEEEPPPSYSDDPYAFDLGDTTARYAPKSDDEDDEEEPKRGYHTSSRRSSKSSKLKKDKDDSSKRSDKSRGKERTASRGEAKPTRTLEDRVAEILKRTGSTAYPSGSVAEEKRGDDDDDNAGYDHDSDIPQTKTETYTKPMATKEISGTSAAKNKASADVEAKANDSDESSDLHRLSFSDSLGMESADFEVGALAKRKLERSRLSLSSLYSEKFAVNMDALEESEHVSHNRYDQPNDDFGPSIAASEPADSDYGDDGFELDQTTEGIAERGEDVMDRLYPPEGSFVSQFESMKSLFSLESPIKPADTFVETQPEEHHHEAATTGIGIPPESDNFGYDDEDFETDEIDQSAGQAFSTADENRLHAQTVDTNDHGRDFVHAGEELQSAEIPANDGPPPVDEHDGELLEGKSQHLADSLPRQPDTPAPFKFEVVSQVISVTETTTMPCNKTASVTETATAPSSEMEENRTLMSAPSRPKSPPPPPPPEEDDVEKQKTQTPPQLELPVSQAQSPTISTTHQPRRSADRLREIEHQVSSLRFMRDRPPPKRSAAVRDRESHDVHDPITFVDDPETVAEIEKIQQLMKQAKRVRKERRRSVSARTSVKENELALRLQQSQRQLLRFKQDVEDLAKGDEEGFCIRTDTGEEKSVHASGSSNGDEGEPSIGKERESSAGREGEVPRRIGDGGKMLRKERDQLKKEMQSQERLILGFQRENELLMKQLKQLQRDVHYDVHKENESLRIQLKELRTLLDGAPPREVVPDGIDSKVQYRAVIEARLQAEALAASLQEELKEQATRHQNRINEMKIELDKVKKAKIDLEYRYEGINRVKMEAESREINMLKEQLQSQKAEHDHTVSALQKKLDWYVKNQRLLDEQDDTINSLREENKRLKDELASGSGQTRVDAPARSPLTPAKSTRLLADVRRIQELESRLSEMEEAMRRRHPDSLVSLLVASRKADDESKLSELNKQHARQLAELIEQMEHVQADNEKKLNAFRQQQEKLVLQYQKQIADVERQLANKENSCARTTIDKTKTKKLVTVDEDELYRVRRFYAEKIKEVERKWEAKYRAVKKHVYASTGSSFPDNTASDRSEASPSDAARVIRTLHQRIASLEDEVRRLRSGGATGTENDSREVGDLRRRIASVESQLKTSEDARRHLIETISSLSAMAAPAVAADARSGQSEEEEKARRERELEAKLISVQKDHDQSVEAYREQINSLKQQLTDGNIAQQQLIAQVAGHISEIDRLQKLLTDAEYSKRRLQASVEKVPALESEVAMLREELLTLPQTPSMLQFRSLEMRIETLTQKHQLREAELKMLLAQATQSSQLEKLSYERLYRNAIALKNAEIRKFKTQLGEILDELETLRRAGSPSPST